MKLAVTTTTVFSPLKLCITLETSEEAIALRALNGGMSSSLMAEVCKRASAYPGADPDTAWRIVRELGHAVDRHLAACGMPKV